MQKMNQAWIDQWNQCRRNLVQASSEMSWLVGTDTHEGRQLDLAMCEFFGHVDAIHWTATGQEDRAAIAT